LLRRIIHGHYGPDWFFVFRDFEAPDLNSTKLNKIEMFHLWRRMALRAAALIWTFYFRKPPNPYELVRDELGPIPRDVQQTLDENGQELALELARGRIRISGSQLTRATAAPQTGDSRQGSSCFSGMAVKN
jgi:hypothetical protein